MKIREYINKILQEIEYLNSYIKSNCYKQENMFIYNQPRTYVWVEKDNDDLY